MLARVPWSPAPKEKPAAKRISKDRKRLLVDRTADILRKGEPTPFAFEAACRHGIRSSLCESGWSWAAADAIAADIVSGALNRIGAKRPNWYQGQPEWPDTLVERTRCIRCGTGLPEGHWKYCSGLCSNAHKLTYMRIRLTEEADAYDRAVKAVGGPE